MDELFIDALVWNSDRLVTYKPKHFVTSETPLTKESKLWILKSLTGRFSIETYIRSKDHLPDLLTLVSFEDPAELILYELTWS